MTACGSHCGGRCLLRVHVRDGAITRIETDNGEEPQLRACLRCRAYRQRVYDPGRLKFPMRRTGERGEGKFEQISWDEALDTTAKKLLELKEKYGPESFGLSLGEPKGMEFAFGHRLADVWGTPNVATPSHL